jgi:hypothetical protein
MNSKPENRKTNGLLRGILVACFILVAVSMSGCATTKPADFVMDGFDSAAVDSLAVLPVLDHRIDKKKQLKLDDWVMPIAKRSLKKLGYAYSLEKDRSVLLGISQDDLEAPTNDFIASLPPSNARWILILSLEDSTSKMTFGSTGNAEMSGYLFDKEIGQITWRNKEVGQAGQGGLIGMTMKGLMERSAIEMAAGQMFQALPSRKN